MNGKFAKKVFQKIAAVGTGVGLMGATILGASAAGFTLADFPEPIVKEGVFNGQIVIGANAKTSDVIGATDIATSLQFAATSGGFTAQGAKVKGQGDSALIAEGGDFLNLGEFFSDVVDAGFDDSDMPNFLKDGILDENEGNTKNDETYTQEIRFPGAAGPQLVFEDEDDGDEVVKDYVKVDNGDVFYAYQIEFDTPIEYDATSSTTAIEDLEDSVFEMQGKLYTVTNVKVNSSKHLTEVEVIGGEELTVIRRGDVRNIESGGFEYEFEVLDVTSPEADDDECLISINGEVRAIRQDDTETFFKETDQEVVVGITDIFQLYGESGDSMCEVIIGHQEIEFDHKGNVQLGGTDVGDGPNDPEVDTDAYVGSRVSSTIGSWEMIQYNVTVEDDVFLGSATDGPEWVDPVLNSFKVGYHGLFGETEHVEFRASSNDAAFQFTNNEKRLVNVDMFNDDDTAAKMNFGQDNDQVLLIESSNAINPANRSLVTAAASGYTNVEGDGSVWLNQNTVIFNGSAVSLSNLEETMLFVVTKGQTAHIISVKDINPGDNELDLEDETYGRDFSEEKTLSGTLLLGKGPLAAGDNKFELGSVGTVTLQIWAPQNMSSTKPLEAWNKTGTTAVAMRLVDGNLGNARNVNLNRTTSTTSLYDQGAETWGQSIVVLDQIGVLATSAINVTILETDDITDVAAANRSKITTGVAFDTTDDQVVFRKPFSSVAFVGTGSFEDESRNNDNDQYAMTRAGSLVHIKEDSDSAGDVEFVEMDLAAGEARYGLAYVSEIPVTILAGGAGGGTAQRIEVGATVLDRNAMALFSDNQIIVGGPCVNTLAAELMGNPADCTTGYAPGKAMIKLFEKNGKVAILVAGYAAEDTTRAARFLADYEANANKMEGKELEVGLTTVTKVA